PPVRLPTYAWQRERFWTDARPADTSRESTKRRDAAETIDDWFHRIEWRRADASTAASSPSRGAWLVLADRSGVGDALAIALKKRGDACITVDHGSAYADERGEAFTIDAARPDHLRRLRDDLRRRGVVLRGVVHLWALDAQPGDRPTAAAL